MKKSFMSKIQRYLAFTLAEVVMVMGIIGVIGILGVSNAKKDTDTSEKVAQLRKTYEILDAAFTQAVMENGKIDKWGADASYPTAAEIWQVINPYLEFSKKCETNSGCWKNAAPIGIDKQASNINIDTSANFEKAILSNGVSIAILDKMANLFDSQNVFPFILVDVNGKKGLNMFGNDIFAFEVHIDGTVVPSNSVGHPTWDINSTQIDVYRTQWVIQFGNMDYLKPCADELSWTGSHTCR